MAGLSLVAAAGLAVAAARASSLSDNSLRLDSTSSSSLLRPRLRFVPRCALFLVFWADAFWADCLAVAMVFRGAGVLSWNASLMGIRNVDAPVEGFCEFEVEVCSGVGIGKVSEVFIFIIRRRLASS